MLRHLHRELCRDAACPCATGRRFRLLQGFQRHVALGDKQAVTLQLRGGVVGLCLRRLDVFLRCLQRCLGCRDPRLRLGTATRVEYDGAQGLDLHQHLFTRYRISDLELNAAHIARDRRGDDKAVDHARLAFLLDRHLKRRPRHGHHVDCDRPRPKAVADGRH